MAEEKEEKAGKAADSKKSEKAKKEDVSESGKAAAEKGVKQKAGKKKGKKVSENKGGKASGKKGDKPPEESEQSGKKGGSKVDIKDSTPAQVVKVFKRVGIYGECYQVLVRILEGKDRGNLLRRNVRGAVKENDLLMLKETERDVRAV